MIGKLLRSFGTISKGEGFDKKIFYTNKRGKIISPWHDIELYNENSVLLNTFIEIPKNTTPKYEVNLEHEFNPII